MANVLIINEKPSVSMEFSRVLGVKQTEKHDGYIEGYSDFFGCTIWITWCIGHLVTLSFPEKYDEKYKKWNIDDLPFLPKEYLYEVIPDVKKQFNVVKKLLNTVGTSDNDRKELSTLSDEKKFLVPAEVVYYAGDLDPEGLLIAQKISEYYAGEFHYWHMTVEDYEKSKSNETISEKRIKSLERITDTELFPVAEKMRLDRLAGYQEKIEIK